MIAHTELAFAYNRGAHESVRQAMSNGLMGRCEKVLTTAGTNRVCGRCMDLSGTVVGFEDKFFNSSVTDGQTPPLHPRCRCVIVYREIDSPRGKNASTFAESHERNLSTQSALILPSTRNSDSGGNLMTTSPNSEENFLHFSILDTEITDTLPDSDYSLTVSLQKQRRHIKGTKEYERYCASQLEKSGRMPSVLNEDVDVIELVKAFHRKGIYYPNPKDNSPREVVDTGQIIGQYWDKNENKLVDTTWIEIVYSKKTVHIFPVKPRQ